MSVLIASWITLVLICALLFLICGNVLIGKLNAVRDLETAKTKLTPIKTSKPIKKNELLPVLGRRLLDDIAPLPSTDPASTFAHRTLTDVLQILHFRRHSLKKIVHELNLYCSLLLIAALFATGKVAYEVNFELSDIINKANSQPFAVLAFFELLMIILFSIRLFIELQIIRELLDD